MILSSLKQIYYSLSHSKRHREPCNWDCLPIELWINIVHYIAAVERFDWTPTKLPCWHDKDPRGHDPPSLRALRSTSKFFYEICFPLRCEDVIICGNFNYFQDAQGRSSPESILKDSRVAPLIRTLDWTASLDNSLFTPAAARNLKSLHLRRVLLTTELCNQLFSFPFLTRLTIIDSEFDFAYSDQDLSSCRVTSLVLCNYEQTSGLLNFVDVISHLPKLAELEVASKIADSVFHRLLSSPTPFLFKPETLIIAEHTRFEWDFRQYQRFFERHCSELRFLSVNPLKGPPSASLGPVAKYLPSLRKFHGPADFANCCVTPFLEELQLSAPEYYWGGYENGINALRDLKNIPISPINLQKLELCTAVVTDALLQDILEYLPNLKHLAFLNIERPRLDLNILPNLSSQLPINNNLSSGNLSSFIITQYPDGECFNGTPQELLKWQRRVVKLWGQSNPRLATIGIYYMCWQRPVGSEKDCDWGWTVLDPANWRSDARGLW